MARRYWSRTSGETPLLVKINGKTSIPSDDRPLSVHTGHIEDAIRLGAVAIGYTMYYGSPRQDEDIPQLASVRRDCERFGLPLFVWAYPRGAAIDAKGGRDTNYALESAARMAAEMGASVVKSNIPKPASDEFATSPAPSYYRDVERSLQEQEKHNPVEGKRERVRRVVRAAAGVPVLFSGGSELSDAHLLENAQTAIDAGAFGFIFGRNMWKRPHDDALRITHALQEKLDT